MATKAQLEIELAILKKEKSQLLNEVTKANNEIIRLKEVKSDDSIVKGLEKDLEREQLKVKSLVNQNTKLETKLKKAQIKNVELQNEINAKTQIETNQVHNERGAGRKKTKLNMSQEELKQAIEKNGIDAVAKELGVSKRTIYRRLKTNDKIN